MDDPPLDDAEPQWESTGYRRDLGTQLPREVEATLTMPETLAARPLPSIGNTATANDDDNWNL